MFSENPLTSIALVLAILAYVGAVRLALRQRLGVLRHEMKKIEDGLSSNDITIDWNEWEHLRASAQSHSTAVILLMPADIVFIGVAILLVLMQSRGSPMSAIDWLIICGAVYLVFLHAHQWCAHSRIATRKNHPPEHPDDQTPDNADPPAAAKKRKDAKGRVNELQRPFCLKLWYWAAAFGVPVALVVGFAFWSTSDKNLLEDPEAHYKLGRELYEQGRFDAAIVQHQHAIGLNPKSAPYHYALAKAMARKNAKYSPLAALKQAIENDCDFREKAKNDPAFGFMLNDPCFAKLVGSS